MLLFVLVELFLLAKIQGEIVKDCLDIDDHCSDNNDCCSHKCLYSTESSNSACVLEVETSLDSPLALPIVSHSFCFYNRAKCSTDHDCYCSQKCFFDKGKSYGFCSRVVPKPPNRQTTTVLSVEKPGSCALLGSYCLTNNNCCSKKCHRLNFCTTIMKDLLSKEDSNEQTTTIKVAVTQCSSIGDQCSENTDCCSNKCGRGAGKYYDACILNTSDSFDKKFFELPPILTKPTVCIMPGHYCVANDDCCTKKCANSKSNRHFHYCQFDDGL